MEGVGGGTTSTKSRILQVLHPDSTVLVGGKITLGRRLSDPHPGPHEV